MFVIRLFWIFIFVFSFNSFGYPGVTATPTRTPDPVEPSLSEPWGSVCADQQIYDLCNKFLIKQFGEEWADHYKPVEVKTENNYKLIIVKYSFLGPGNHKAVVEPEFDFFFEPGAKDNCKSLRFWRGLYFVAPYVVSGLLTVRDAKKIASKNGFDAEFSSLEFFQSKKRLGKLFLYVPQYRGWSNKGGVGYGGEVVVDAEDGSFLFIPTVPGAH